MRGFFNLTALNNLLNVYNFASAFKAVITSMPNITENFSALHTAYRQSFDAVKTRLLFCSF
jgi:hypothetical protein